MILLFSAPLATWITIGICFTLLALSIYGRLSPTFTLILMTLSIGSGYFVNSINYNVIGNNLGAPPNTTPTIDATDTDSVILTQKEGIEEYSNKEVHKKSRRNNNSKEEKIEKEYTC